MLYLITYEELIVIIKGEKMNDSDEEKEKLTFDDIDILESIGSDLYEGIREDVDDIKKKTK
jgi:hypothetical protein